MKNLISSSSTKQGVGKDEKVGVLGNNPPCTLLAAHDDAGVGIA